MNGPKQSRRGVLKMIGGGAVVGGTGLAAMSGSAAAGRVSIGAANPDTVKNDRGDVSQVTVDPTFRVEWENLDVAVGKVFYVIEASVGGGDYWPVFRSTPWLTPDAHSVPGVNLSKPGTSGHLEFGRLSAVMSRSVDARGDTERNNETEEGWPDLPIPRAITVADERDRPDYEAFFDSNSVSGSSYDGYVGGNSIGDAPEAMMSAAAGPDDPLALVNHFPGAASGVYGAAAGADDLDNDDDGTASATTVSLRYTFELLTVNRSLVSYLSDDVGEGWLSNVRESDLQAAGPGDNSVLAMNGEDGYGDLAGDDDSDGTAYGTASQDYGELRALADTHPGVIVEGASFDVKAVNEKADTGVTGSSNAGAN